MVFDLVELRHRGKVLDSTSGVQGRLHGTVLCAVCLEGTVGAGKAEDPRGGIPAGAAVQKQR